MSIFNRRNITIAAIVIGIPVLALAWWLGSPLFLDNEVDEDFPSATETTTTTIAEGVEADLDATTGDNETTAATPAPSEPATIATGMFRDADAFHLGSGSATLYQLEDGSRVLRFEDFEVTNGPDLHVYLVPHENPAGPDDVGGYLDLGELKGNIGDQNYEIPDEVDLSAYHSVVIYCEPFHVVFAVAGLGTQGT